MSQTATCKTCNGVLDGASAWFSRSVGIDVEPEEAGSTLMHGDIVYLRTSLWKHVDIQNDRVQARWADHGDWQALRVELVSLWRNPGDAVSQPIVSGTVVTLRSIHYGTCIALGAEGGITTARATSSHNRRPDVSQTFVIERLGWRVHGRCVGVGVQSALGETIHGGDLVGFQPCALPSCRLAVRDDGAVGFSSSVRSGRNTGSHSLRLELKDEHLPKHPVAKPVVSIAPAEASNNSSSSTDVALGNQQDQACAICCGELSEQDAAMRCAGQAGQHHYYHTACLREWIRTCQSQSREPSCPVCRGALQAHQGRLQALLEDPSTTPDDRNLLQGAAAEGVGGWSDFRLSPEVKHGLGVAAAAGVGLLQGAFGGRVGSGCPIEDDGRGHTQVAHTVGVGIGVALALARVLTKK